MQLVEFRIGGGQPEGTTAGGPPPEGVHVGYPTSGILAETSIACSS